MKNNRKFSIKSFFLLALTATMLLTMATPAFALSDEVLQSIPADIRASSTDIKTNWDTSGCWLHGSFDSNNVKMKQYRLTFQGAYDLYAHYTNLYYANTADSVFNRSYASYGKLSNYLSSSTVNQCWSNDGVSTLYNLKNTYEYRNNATVRTIVDGELYLLEVTYPDRVRESLAFFYPASMLKSLPLSQLTYLAYITTSTPEYKFFHNSLYGHDCSAVRALTAQGYSQDYVRYSYTYQAEQAIKEIWPDYEQRVADYRNATHAW